MDEKKQGPEQDAAVRAPGTETTIPPGETDAGSPFLAIDPRHYAIDREIARGGMGRILAARDRRLDRPVAIKELLAGQGLSRARFEREARITARLQHPAIVGVLEAGTWPSGEPFYVMKLVTGTSLDEVIAARSTLEARLALLPNVIAAVDALAYAHDRQVIHRDLKPSNVLVGEFGETVVIDWGLAKDLAEVGGGAGSAEASPPVPDAPGETIAGSIMGTPAYMPPEQAKGHAVDMRADVYALGAMLYHVLAGVPPYGGKTPFEVLDAVIAGPPRPIGDHVAGVPPDLVTIVEKAMSRDASGRYPSAKELADDLKKFQTGQLVGAHRYTAGQLLGRWIRRHRTPVGVAAIAAVLGVVSGAISLNQILHERQVAEESRDEAEELMSFMLVDLGDKLEPIGKLGLLEDVARKAADYYRVRPETGRTDDDQLNRSTAHMNLGDVLLDKGDAAQALDQFRAGLAIRRRLVSKDPANAEWQRELSVADDRVGYVLLVQGDLAGALEAFRASLASAKSLAARDPENEKWQRDLSIAHEQIGDVLILKGDADGALEEFRASLAIQNALVARDPGNDGLRHDLMSIQGRVGDALVEQGDLTRALEELQAALAIGKSLVAKDPENAPVKRNLSIAYLKVGDVLFSQGELARALESTRASLALSTELVAHDPSNSKWQRDRSLGHERVGEVLLAQGDTAQALESFRALLAISRSLAAQDPTNTVWQRNLSIGHDRMGDVLFAQKAYEPALASYRAALAITETLATREPANSTWQRDLSLSHQWIGDVLLAQKHPDRALDEYRAGLAIAEPLAARDATNAVWRNDVARIQERAGEALAALGDAAGALDNYRASRAVRKQLADQDPTNTEWQEALSNNHQRAGELLEGRRDIRLAAEEYRAALGVLERLQSRAPASERLRRKAAELRGRLEACCADAPHDP